MSIIRPRKVRKPPPKPTGPLVVTLTLSIRESVFLDALVAGGLHGGSRQEVLRNFLRIGLREAYKDGLIK